MVEKNFNNDRRTNDQRLNELSQKLDAHISESHQRFGDLLDAQLECTKAVQNLTETTRGVVEVYNNLNGAIVVGKKVQTFGLWLLKWPVIGYGLYHLAKQVGILMDKVG